MSMYAAVLGALVATQGAAALQTRVVPERQFPPPDVCHPMGTITFDTTYPPCLSQGDVEGKCAPVTEDQAGWAKQRDCMCKGSFFEDAIGCGACKQCNALQGHDETAHWNTIFKDIQANFCKEATPTGNFGTFWTSALAAHGSPVATPDDKRDRCVKPGDTVVENYYKATKTQGPWIPDVSPTSVPTSAVSKATDAPASFASKASDAHASVVSSGTKVELHAAASVRYSVAMITGLPAVPNGPKFPINATSSVDNNAKAEVHFALASMPCNAVFVNGSVQPSCGPFNIIANSSAMVSSSIVKEGAVDFGACSCAQAYLAPQKQRAVVGPVSSAASASASVVLVFSPQECTRSCNVPAPAPAPKDEVKPKPTESKVNCATGVPSKPSEKKASDDKPSENKTSGDEPSENKAPKESKTSGDKPSENKAPKDKAPEESKASGDKPSEGKSTPKQAESSDKTSVPAGPAQAPSKGDNGVKPAPPVGTGVPVAPATGPSNASLLTGGAGSTGVSAVLAIAAVAVFAL